MVWTRFSLDPRDPKSAAMRASDADRQVIADVLGEAFADGRLDEAEFGERTDRLAQAKLLGDLPPLIGDLAPVTPQAWLAGPDLEARARLEWRHSFNTAAGTMVLATVITGVIWMATGMGYPWFLWVLFGTGINVLRVVVRRSSIIAEEQQRLERKQRKAIEKQQRKSADPGRPPGRPAGRSELPGEADGTGTGSTG